MSIRTLPDHIVNRIAAGEVIERPASVVKELIENALDAGSTRIDIALHSGGKSRIIITDDGPGMTQADLKLCIERHATSKLSDDDLVHINTLGFRGEALASIGSVARLSIQSRHNQEPHAWSIGVEGGRLISMQPATLSKGTRIEISDLFFAVPARLKFLKSDRAEIMACNDMIKRLAMARPDVRFVVSNDGKTTLDLPVRHGQEGFLQRLAAIIDKDFADNAIALDCEREGVRLSGFAGLPTYNKATARDIHLYVNGRAVKDKLMFAAVRAGYRDVLAKDRHPVVTLFLDIAPERVDVNVHPAKAEVRFRDASHMRGLIVSAITNAVQAAAFRSSTTGGLNALSAFQTEEGHEHASYVKEGSQREQEGFKETGDVTPFPAPSARYHPQTSYKQTRSISPAKLQTFATMQAPSADIRQAEEGHHEDAEAQSYPLGAARAQLHETYIIAQSEAGLVIVDQHAAHERLVYEQMKQSYAARNMETQILLIPEVVEMNEDDVTRLNDAADDLKKLGLDLEAFGDKAVLVRETPSILGQVHTYSLIKDIAEELSEWSSSYKLEERIHAIISRMSCHYSIRSGRRMRAEEMNALLRLIEKTPGSGQCNHGRPTWIELKLSDIEKLFGRR
jgi:DNA mismatch repair protein MutL